MDLGCRRPADYAPNDDQGGFPRHHPNRYALWIARLIQRIENGMTRQPLAAYSLYILQSTSTGCSEQRKILDACSTHNTEELLCRLSYFLSAYLSNPSDLRQVVVICRGHCPDGVESVRS